ncbi:MAG TPA: PQQ-binding-like beta-propeller repeat protein [Vicinamibacterales bacterium]|nr:PQQ-binding-like beta-propeller repeat protein [Vicinamibacterales bacterium]
MHKPAGKRGLSPFFVVAVAGMLGAAQAPPRMPDYPLQFAGFAARFQPDGTFTLEGAGWPSFRGTWKVVDGAIELLTPGAPGGCENPGRYRVHSQDGRTTLDLVADDCGPRRMILDRSSWRRAGEKDPVPERTIVRTAAPRSGPLPSPAPAAGSWPAFRGPMASGIADGMNLPDTWNPATGLNIRWRAAIPGLAHSSPIVWGDRVFVTSAVSTRADATFKPGLYGDGDASDDRTQQRWTIYALDRVTGKVLWERVAHEGEPREKRHIKSTYASATPATDGRIVVASFGSHGLHAYDVNGAPLWTIDLGRMDVGAYDIPTFEWGTASSPVIWNGLVILQVDTQADSFLIAVKAETGETVWKTAREELPSWGTPTVAETAAGPVLVTNASNFIRGYDPRTGRELWRLGGSSKITAPTPIFAGGLFVIASGRAPERPIFAVRPEAKGNITLGSGITQSEAVAWSKVNRGSYMPTPLAYKGILYVLANNGQFDAYDLATGAEIYRQRLSTIGNGFSASPVAADDKIYLSNEDGDIIVITAGSTFAQIAVNSMGELVMATPALSRGVMYVRGLHTLFAIGR